MSNVPELVVDVNDTEGDGEEGRGETDSEDARGRRDESNE